MGAPKNLPASPAPLVLTFRRMSESERRRATYEDILAIPPSVVAEVVEGILYQSPRPAIPHAAAASAVGEELGPPFKRGRGGPGG